MKIEKSLFKDFEGDWVLFLWHLKSHFSEFYPAFLFQVTDETWVLTKEETEYYILAVRSLKTGDNSELPLHPPTPPQNRKWAKVFLFQTPKKWKDYFHAIQEFIPLIPVDYTNSFRNWLKLESLKYYPKDDFVFELIDQLNQPVQVKNSKIHITTTKSARGRKEAVYEITPAIKADIDTILEELKGLKKFNKILLKDSSEFTDLQELVNSLQDNFEAENGEDKAWNTFLRNDICTILQPYFPSVIETKTIAEKLFRGEKGCFKNLK